jgi:hypothetical protein
MWQGLQAITDYKGKTSHFTDTDVLLLDKINIFFARFEENTMPPTWATAAQEDGELTLSMANLTKTF